MKLFPFSLCALVAAALLGGAPAALADDAAARDAAAHGPRLDKIDFRDVPLGEACRLLSEQAGMNIVPSAEAGRQSVSIFLENVALMDAVEVLCRAHQLWFQRDARTQIVHINTVSEYKKNLTTFQEEETEYFTLLYPNALDVGYAIRNLFGDRVDLRFGLADQDLVEDLEDRLERFDIFDQRTQGFGALSQGTSGFGGYDGTFGSGSSSRYSNTSRYGRSRSGYGTEARDDSRGRTTSYAESESRERKPLEMTAEEILDLEKLREGGKADANQRAVALLESLAERQQAPINVTVIRRHNKVVVRTRDKQALEHIRTLVERLDIPTPLVLLEVRVIAIELGDDFTSFFEYQWADSDGELAGSFTSGTIQNPVPPSLDLGGTGLNAGALIFQYVSDQFAARVQLLEEKRRIEVLATPLLLTANNEVSRLFVGREVPLNRSFEGSQVLTNESTTTTTPGTTNIEFRPVGTTLLVTPNINSDRTVTLRIVQEQSDINSTETVLVPNQDGFVEQQVNVVSSQTVSGTIVAKSELAIAFGGLIETRVNEDRAQIPILGDIPLLGYLFRRQVDKSTQREIVIIVRPHVLSTPAESEAVSRRVLEETGVSLNRLPLRRHAEDGEDAEKLGTPGGFPFRLHGLEHGDL